MAIELGPEGILVNSVNVGFVATPQWERIRQVRAPGSAEADFFARMAAGVVPLSRFGDAVDVAGVVAFISSDRGRYLTGTSIDVAGGMGTYV